MTGPIMERLDAFAEEIVAVRNANVERERAAEDARRASLAVFRRAEREKRERAEASRAVVAEMRMGGAI